MAGFATVEALPFESFCVWLSRRGCWIGCRVRVGGDDRGKWLYSGFGRCLLLVLVFTH